MRCSFTNDHVRIIMPQDRTSGYSHQKTVHTDYYDLMQQKQKLLVQTALQRPELNRAQLAKLLRAALKTQKSRKAQKTYWHAFLTTFSGKSANSNDARP